MHKRRKCFFQDTDSWSISPHMWWLLIIASRNAFIAPWPGCLHVTMLFNTVASLRHTHTDAASSYLGVTWTSLSCSSYSTVCSCETFDLWLFVCCSSTMRAPHVRRLCIVPRVLWGVSLSWNVGIKEALTLSEWFIPNYTFFTVSWHTSNLVAWYFFGPGD